MVDGRTIGIIARQRVTEKRIAAKLVEFERREREHNAKMADLLQNPPIPMKVWDPEHYSASFDGVTFSPIVSARGAG